MTLYTNTFEGGTSGTVITQGNSGGTSGDAFGSAPQGSPVFDNARASHGSLSAKLTPVSGSPCYVQFGAVGSGWASTQFAVSFYAYFTALPTAIYTLFRANDDNPSAALRFNLDTAGKVALAYNNGTGTVTPWTSTTAIPLNQWVRFEGRVERSATNGIVAGAFYAGDSTTALDSYASANTLNTGTAPITQAAFGKYGSDTTATAFWLDDLRANTATTSFIGPYVVPAAANVRPNGISTNPGAWVNDSGATPTGGSTADESDATYITNPGAADGESITLTLPPVTSGNGRVLVRCLKPVLGTSGNLVVDVMQGSTVKATRTITAGTTGTAYDSTSGLQSYTLDLTSGENATIVQGTTLLLRLTTQPATSS